MNLDTINAYLTPRYVAALADHVARLEAGIVAGAVKNMHVVDAKFYINRAVEDALKAFDERTGIAYADRDVMVMGAYNLPAALKEAVKKKTVARADFIRAMMPLNDLLQAVKPLIVKRGQGPKVPTAKQAARLAHTMTCQCCARPIFAETGAIAHHGYERPGDGYQTPSCMGARHLPFEVDRAELGRMIATIKTRLLDMRDVRATAEAETLPIMRDYTDYRVRPDARGNRPTVTLTFTRATFADVAGDGVLQHHTRPTSFDALKASDLAARDQRIASLAEYLVACEARFAGWKQTHAWQGGKWVGV